MFTNFGGFILIFNEIALIFLRLSDKMFSYRRETALQDAL